MNGEPDTEFNNRCEIFGPTFFEIFNNIEIDNLSDQSIK